MNLPIFDAVKVPVRRPMPRKFALDIAFELLDRIRSRWQKHVLTLSPDGVAKYRRFPCLACEPNDIVGTYDVGASASEIADDLQAMYREPIHG